MKHATALALEPKIRLAARPIAVERPVPGALAFQGDRRRFSCVESGLIVVIPLSVFDMELQLLLSQQFRDAEHDLQATLLDNTMCVHRELSDLSARTSVFSAMSGSMWRFCE